MLDHNNKSALELEKIAAQLEKALESETRSSSCNTVLSTGGTNIYVNNTSASGFPQQPSTQYHAQQFASMVNPQQ